MNTVAVHSVLLFICLSLTIPSTTSGECADDYYKSACLLSENLKRASEDKLVTEERQLSAQSAQENRKVKEKGILEDLSHSSHSDDGYFGDEGRLVAAKKKMRRFLHGRIPHYDDGIDIHFEWKEYRKQIGSRENQQDQVQWSAIETEAVVINNRELRLCFNN